MTVLDHYENYEWLGFFWTPDKELEFPGKLTYSPEEGVRLEFMYPTGKEIKKYEHIHGALATGEICTLFGDFDPDNFGFHFGKIAIHKARPRFYAVIFGRHTSIDESFSGAALDLTNFQEFCHPQGFKKYAKYSTKPLFEHKLDDIEISIVNTGKFISLDANIDSLFHCENEEVINELKQAISTVIKKHKNESILAREDIGWELHILSSHGLILEKILYNIALFERLFSLLIYSPVRRSKTWILAKSESNPEKFTPLPLLTSLFDISGSKIKLLKREISNLHQAITPRNIPNFSLVISNWMKHHEGFQSFAQRIENRFQNIHEHELRAEIILALAQLEAIAHDLGHKKEKEKYDTPIQIYDKTKIQDTLRSALLTSANSTIGQLLSELRGEIAHVGRPAKLIKKMGPINLLITCRCIDLIISSHIYKKLGIPEANITKFQTNNLP